MKQNTLGLKKNLPIKGGYIFHSPLASAVRMTNEGLGIDLSSTRYCQSYWFKMP